MIRKIIGATVGTSISPEALKKKLNIESGSGGNILFVDITLVGKDNYISNHSASEIKAHLENGGFSVGRYVNNNLLVHEIKEDFVSFIYHEPGGLTSQIFRVFEDKTVKILYESHGHSDIVLSSSAQSLSNAQKSQARENIGALSEEDVTDAVNEALDQAKENGDLSADLSDEEYAELMALLEEE